MASLDRLLAVYPWLHLLADDVLVRLDVEELVDPHPVALRLGPTVVAYRRGARPRPGRFPLCTVVPAARITAGRAGDLARAERDNPGIVLVEYAPESHSNRWAARCHSKGGSLVEVRTSTVWGD